MLGEEHGQHREAAETLTSGVQLELGRVLGSGAWEGTGREVKVFENPGGDGRAEDAGHHAARAAAAEAGEDVHGERPLQQLGPGQPEQAGSGGG